MRRRYAGSMALGRSVSVLMAFAVTVWSCGTQATVSSPAASPIGTTAPAPPHSRTPDAQVVAGAITEAGLGARVDELARVGTDPAGYRSVGAPGYDAAADLIATGLREAGWQVTEDVFTTPAFADLGGSELTVGPRSFGVGDILPIIFAPGGDVTGPVVAIDWDEDAREPTGRGCDVSDYGDLPDGAIVLVRSGPCLRREQVLAAQQAGAAAFVAGYPAAASGEVLRPTLIEPAGLDIPVASASRPVGNALAEAAATGSKGRLVTRATTSPTETRSIIADLPGNEPETVIMLGAHLDSVIDGPGINDNASGVAALLEIAQALSDAQPRATIRLAFWSAEELGLHGSFRYVTSLTAPDRAAIAVYLNADMVASPNGYAGVYDEGSAAAGSTAVRDLLLAAVERDGGVPVTVDVGGGSDHLAFTQAGIATGGVFAGALEPVSAEQAAARGSTEGLPADACYHRPCDDGSALDLGLARQLTAALAEVAVQLSNGATLSPG